VSFARGQLRPVLILAYHFPPENESGAARPYRFYRYLPDFGYRPYVVAAGEPDPAQPREDVHHVPNRFLVPTRSTLGGLSEMVGRKFFFPHDVGVNWSRAAYAEAEKVVGAHSIPIMISTAPPFTTALAALRLKRRFGLKWVADFRDPLVGNPFRVQHGLPHQIDKFLNRQIFERADAILGVSDKITSDWVTQYPAAAPKIHLIWNGFDPAEAFGPAPSQPRPYKVLSHVGAIMGGRHPVVVLESILRLIGRGLLNPNEVRIRLVGSLEQRIVDEHASVFTALKARGCLECAGHEIPKAEAMQVIAQSDYLLLLDGNVLDLGFAVPAKLFDYVRAGHPMLVQTARNSPVERILAKSAIPSLFVYPGDVPELVDEQILDLFSRPATPSVPSPWFWQEFDGKRQTEKLARLLDGLVTVPAGSSPRLR